MEVIKIVPRGFCIGVVNSINIAKKAALENKEKKVYMIGMLVHNKYIIKELEQYNIIYIDDVFKDRKEIIKDIPVGSVVIFSAHGTNEAVVNFAKERGLIVYDTVCEWVEVTRDLIKNKLNEGYKIIFIGKNNHPETIAMTSIDKENIFMIETIDDIEKIKFKLNDKLFVTNQTTLSMLNTDKIYKKLKEVYKNISYKNDICLATTQRQEAVFNLKDKKIDLIIVVGDERSSNTKELVNIGNSIGIKTIRIDDSTSLNDEVLKNVKTVAITAGASTSSIIQNNVIKFLEEY